MPRLRERCRCKFVAIALPMDSRECDVHYMAPYPCDHCFCTDYKPSDKPRPNEGWPTCICGHAAISHN